MAKRRETTLTIKVLSAERRKSAKGRFYLRLEVEPPSINIDDIDYVGPRSLLLWQERSGAGEVLDLADLL